MGVKYFCDICGLEMTGLSSGPVHLTLRIDDETVAAFSGGRGYIICPTCKIGFVKAVNDVIEMMKVALKEGEKNETK